MQRSVLRNRNCFFMVPVQTSYGSSYSSSYIDHKKQLWKKTLKNLAILHSKFKKKKLISFIKFVVKCEWKNVKMKKIKYTILFCVCEISVPKP
jgi:hypothetical protein